MSDFDEALGYVHGVLSDLQSRGATLVAPASALQSLAATARASSAVAPARPAEIEQPKAARFPEAERPRIPRAAEIPAVAPVAPRPRAVLPALPPLPKPAAGGSKAERLAAFREQVLPCVKCEHLARSRNTVVFGVGNPEAELMFVGEAPGADEDLQGEPFVGAAGQLLTKIIVAMGFQRESVYIANVLKCRPDMPRGSTGNRKPTVPEMQTCLPYLQEQIEIIQPRALVALGATALEGLLGITEPMGKVRGRWMEFRGIPLMVTYHPAYLLRNQALSEKRKVWEDMLMVLEKLGQPISEKQRGYFLKG